MLLSHFPKTREPPKPSEFLLFASQMSRASMENKETPRKNSREVNPVPDDSSGAFPEEHVTETLPDAATSTPLLPAGAAGFLKTTAKHAGGRPRLHAGRHSGHPLEGDEKRAADRQRFRESRATVAAQVHANPPSYIPNHSSLRCPFQPRLQAMGAPLPPVIPTKRRRSESAVLTDSIATEHPPHAASTHPVASHNERKARAAAQVHEHCIADTYSPYS